MSPAKIEKKRLYDEAKALRDVPWIAASRQHEAWKRANPDAWRREVSRCLKNVAARERRRLRKEIALAAGEGA